MVIIDPLHNEPQIETGSSQLVIRSVAAPCAHCGEQIEITPPHSWRSTAPHHDGDFPSSLTLWPKYGDPSLCLRCRLRATPEEKRDWLRDEYIPLLDAAIASRVPTGYPIWPIYGSADDLAGPKKWRGFRVRWLGIQVSGLPTVLTDIPNVNAFRIHDNMNRRSFGFLVYETVIWHEKIPASLIFVSDPLRSETNLEIRNWQRVERLEQLQRLMQGVEIYRAFRAELGRRPGTGRFAPGEEADFAQEVERKLSRAERDGLRLNNAQMLADQLGMGKTALYDMFKRAPEARQRFREHQRRLPNYSN